MFNQEKLLKALETPEFFKKNIPNVLFIFSSWKKDFERYKNAQKRNIVTNHLLRQSEHEDFFYNTYAISLEGELAPAAVEQLKQFAQSMPLGNIRFMAHATNGFFPLVDENGVNVDTPDIKLGMQGVYLFTVSDTKKETIDCPCTVVVWLNREIKKWPLSQKILSSL